MGPRGYAQNAGTGSRVRIRAGGGSLDSPQSRRGHRGRRAVGDRGGSPEEIRGQELGGPATPPRNPNAHPQKPPRRWSLRDRSSSRHGALRALCVLCVESHRAPRPRETVPHSRRRWVIGFTAESQRAQRTQSGRGPGGKPGGDSGAGAWGPRHPTPEPERPPTKTPTPVVAPGIGVPPGTEPSAPSASSALSLIELRGRGKPSPIRAGGGSLDSPQSRRGRRERRAVGDRGGSPEEIRGQELGGPATPPRNPNAHPQKPPRRWSLRDRSSSRHGALRALCVLCDSAVSLTKRRGRGIPYFSSRRPVA